MSTASAFECGTCKGAGKMYTPSSALIDCPNCGGSGEAASNWHKPPNTMHVAVGGNLDRIGMSFDVNREPGETDEALRSRIMRAMRGEARYQERKADPKIKKHKPGALKVLTARRKRHEDEMLALLKGKGFRPIVEVMDEDRAKARLDPTMRERLEALYRNGALTLNEMRRQLGLPEIPD